MFETHSKIKEVGFEKIPGWENLFVHKKWQVLINVYVDDFKVAGKGPLDYVWKALRNAGLDIDDPVKYQTYLGCAQREIKLSRDVLAAQISTYKAIFTHSYAVEAPKESTVTNTTQDSADTLASASLCMHDVTVDNLQKANDQCLIWDKSFDEIWDQCLTTADMSKETPWVLDSVKRADAESSAALHGAARDSQSRVSTAQGTVKLGMHFNMPTDMSHVRAYENEMFGFVQQCIDQWCQLTKINEVDVPYYQTPSIDDHMLSEDDMKEKGKLHDVCSRIVLKILWLTRRVRPDTYWAVNSLTREVSKWTVACDKKAP